MKINNNLTDLYNATSKHSNYQIIAPALKEYLNVEEIHTNSRYEAERLVYIKNNLNLKDKLLVDIGGNTGYFTFTLANEECKKVIYFEGNESHCHFVAEGRNILNLQDKIEIKNQYFEFNKEFRFETNPADIVLNLNVLHHLGDDFHQSTITFEKAKNEIISKLNILSYQCKMMAFQIGFNWKGNRSLPLFTGCTKKELIDFITENCKEHWNIIQIGIAEKTQNEIVYRDINKMNIERDDSLGEFLNRPLFLLESKNII